MNVRFFVLLLFALAVGSGLAWLAWEGVARDGFDGPTIENTGVRDAPQDDASQPGSDQRARTLLPAASFGWDVIVVGPDGTALPDADVRVSAGSETHVSKGWSRFDGLAVGSWRLVVTCDGYPTWDETIVLAPDRDTRTRVRLDTVIRISCTLLDQRGDPIAVETVHALRPGETHPATGYESRSAIHARTGGDGKFRIELPEAGDWIFAVGPPAGAARFVSKTFEVWHGFERFCQLVIPARARLEVTTSSGDYEGGNVLFVLADRREAEVATEGTNDGDSDGSAGDQEVADKGGATSDKGGATSGKDDVSAANGGAARRDGWTAIGQQHFLDGDTWAMADVPERELLRFRLLRGSESLVIHETAVVPAGATVHLHLEPPSPLPRRQARPATSRVCSARLRIEPLDPGDALELGLSWQSR